MDAPAVMIVARGAVWWGYALERRGKREAWLIQSPGGGYRYASIHADLYYHDPEAFQRLSNLLCSKDTSDPSFEAEWLSVVDTLKPFS